MSERTEFDGPNYKEKLDITQVFLRQRDRTNFSAGARDGTYEEYVRQTMRMLPIQWKQWVRDQSDRYIITGPVLLYKKVYGRRMGSKDDPFVRNEWECGRSSKEGFDVNRLEDGSVDWSDPRIVSPTLSEKTTTDYEIWDEVIGEASELAGISWQQEHFSGDRGERVSVEPEKTPHRPAQEAPE